MRKYLPHFVVLLITIAGFCLRVYHLDWQCLTIDEKVTFRMASFATMDLVKWALGGDYNPPTYYVLAHLASMYYGEVTLFAIRFPAMIFGTLSIPVAYLVGREFRDDITGILISAVVAFSYPTILYSQNARPYSLVFLIFLCFTFFFIRIYNGDTRMRNVAGLSVFAALCLWSHFYALMPVVVAGLILGWKYKHLVKYAVAMIFLLCLPFVPYFDIVKNQMRVFAIAKGAHYPPGAAWVDPEFVAIMTPNELFCWAWVVIIPMILYALYKYKDSLNTDLVKIAAITTLTMFPMGYITAMLPRYSLLVLPMFLCVAFYPVSKFLEDKTWQQKAVGVVAVAFVIFALNYGSLYQLYTVNLCQFYEILK